MFNRSSSGYLLPGDEWKPWQLVRCCAKHKFTEAQYYGTTGGIGRLQTPGDTLLIREGTYPEIIDNHTAGYPLPSGTNWTNGGFKIAAYPNESVVIQKISLAGDLAYWTFDGLRAVNLVPGNGEAIWVGGQVNHIRFTK